MSLEPREVAALAILAQSPNDNEHIVESLQGTARQIGRAIVNPDQTDRRGIANVAKDIRDWADKNKRLATRQDG